MVKKLIKYDFSSYFKLLFPVQLVLIGIAALNRIVQIFENDSSPYSIIFYSSLILYIISIIVLMVMTTIVAIVRFYQGMYTKEGYLSHTLPVTPTQHIWAKLLTSVLFIFGSLIAIFLSFNVITLGDVNIEIYKALGYWLKDFFTVFKGNGILYVVEFLSVILIAVVTEFLRYYFCISVGQLVSKKRILLAFGVYFGLYALSQVFGTIVVILITISPSWLVSLGSWLTAHPNAAVHIILCVTFVVELVLAALYFLFTKLIMSKKLNLT